MKKYILLFAAVSVCSVTIAQHTQTESKTEMTTNKAMLDGKAFAVTLTENMPGTTGTPGNMTGDKMSENPDLTKRDVEDSKSDKAGTMKDDATNTRKMLIRFENGEVKTSGKGEIKNEKCAYNSWGMESTGISFSADCKPSASMEKKSDSSKAGTLLTGTVNGDTIHGSMTCTKDDGSVKTFSYTGSKAGPNDLDLENEMGMK
jgi:hypothetical protein